MYRTVFISHSKDDPNLEFFHKVFSGLPIESIWMEFEEIEPPPFLSIRDKVNRSDALFVLLSEYLVSRQHTNNWVSLEVGLAANRERSNVSPKDNQGKLGLDVWVFEPLGKDISFAVPYCTYYMRYKPSRNSIKLLKNILRYEFPEKLGVTLTCPWDDCNGSFNYLRSPTRLSSPTHSINCPACRRNMQASWYWFYDAALKSFGKLAKKDVKDRFNG